MITMSWTDIPRTVQENIIRYYSRQNYRILSIPTLMKTLAVDGAYTVMNDHQRRTFITFTDEQWTLFLLKWA